MHGHTTVVERKIRLWILMQERRRKQEQQPAAAGAANRGRRA